MALTYTAAAIQKHAELIEQNIQNITASLTNRQAIPDYETYCHKTGQIEGLRQALELCDEAVRKLNES